MVEKDYTNMMESNPILKKRVYNTMSNKIKYEYAFRTLFLKETGTKVAKELNINYYTAKNMVRLYKTTGSFSKENKNLLEGQEENEKFEKFCRLKISYDEKGILRAGFKHKMNLFEAESLWKLHNKVERGAPLEVWM